MSKNLCFLFCLIAFSHPLFASLSEIPYYPENLVKFRDSLSVESIQEEEQRKLKEKLRATLTEVHLQVAGKRDSLHSNCPDDKPQDSKCLEQRRNISYKQARQYLFGLLHLEKERSDYFVEDQYCQNLISERDGVGPGKIPNSQKINCEHTWPQSRFNRRLSIELQKTDIHHLYPVDSRANSSRGNIPFGEVRNESSSLCQASKRGPTANGTIAFEPPDQHKGNVARAVFYFSLRYDTIISEEEENYLREWHRLDPVDEQELIRNEKIYQIQGNRNPFIDDAELVELIHN